MRVTGGVVVRERYHAAHVWSTPILSSFSFACPPLSPVRSNHPFQGLSSFVHAESSYDVSPFSFLFPRCSFVFISFQFFSPFSLPRGLLSLSACVSPWALVCAPSLPSHKYVYTCYYVCAIKAFVVCLAWMSTSTNNCDVATPRSVPGRGPFPFFSLSSFFPGNQRYQCS